MPHAVPVPVPIERVLQEIDELEAELNLEELLPALLELVRKTRKALDDGRLSLWEILALGRSLVKVVQTAKKARR